MNKRFELTINYSNGQCDIVDWVESKEKNAICIYNDLGNYYFSSAKALCELLNELHEENRQLKEDIDELDKKSDEKIRLIRENTRLKKKLKEHNDMLKWHQGGW